MTEGKRTNREARPIPWPSASPSLLVGASPCRARMQLMRLNESNPEEFAAYAEMAKDAAKLAEERPDLLNQLMQDTGEGRRRGKAFPKA